MKTKACNLALIFPTLIFASFLNAASSGTVTFTGLLVEATCTTKAFNKTANITCIRNQKATTDNVDFDKLNNKIASGNVIYTALLRHINERKNVAMLDVTYQ